MSRSTPPLPEDRQAAFQDQLWRATVNRGREPARIRRFRPVDTVVERHKYRHEIEDLLAAGWAPRNLNVCLGKIHADYQTVPDRTLRWHREHRLSKSRLRPLAAYERLLQDDHVLLHTVRSKAALIVLQKGRLSRALELEEQMPGIVWPQAGHEIDRLVKLLESYEVSLERVGLLSKEPRQPAVTEQNLTAFNLHDEIAREAASMPEDVRLEMGRLLERARLQETEERIGPIEARLRARRPAPIDVDAPPDQPSSPK